MRILRVISILALLAAAFGGVGCANIIPPAGGPRDSLPPMLVRSTPNDSTRNFTGNKISFTFNEFVEIQNPQENLVISPLPKLFPAVEYRLNTVSVKWKDSLESNTTYLIQFGNAIKDFNEGNVLKDFNYTFSTGNYIDSLELSGNVVLAETGKLDTTLIVMLHTDPRDSAVVKDKPRYIAKLDNKGNFQFRNLPAKTFYLYALKDEGGTRRYFRDNQLFAFASKPVTPSLKNEPVTLYAYSSKPANVGATLTIPANRNRLGGTTDKRLKYNPGSIEQDLQSKFHLTFDTPLRSFDSTRLQLFTDSNFVPVPNYSWTLDSTRKVLTLNTEWKEKTLYRLVLEKDFATDTAGRQLLKTDTLNFRTKKLADYGFLKLRIKGLDLKKNPVLLIMNGEMIYKSYPLTSNELTEALFLPGEYELRILFDENKNGKWDPGEFFIKHKQPEIVKTLDRKILIKANFQNEFDISAE